MHISIRKLRSMGIETATVFQPLYSFHVNVFMQTINERTNVMNAMNEFIYLYKL